MAQKLKIGLFIDTFFPMIDGVVMVVDNYAKRLSKIADVTVFAPKGKNKNYVDNFDYKVVRCSRLKVIGFDYDLPTPKADHAFMKELSNSNLDIVHIHSPFALGKVALEYAKKHSIPAVATMHSQFKQDFYKQTKSKLITNILLKSIMKVFNKCDECWAVNEEVADIFIDYGAKVSPLVQKNGTDFQLVKNINEVLDLRKKYGFLKNEKVFLFVGRIHSIKNVFFIADALKILNEKGFLFKMLFVGTGPDEDELKQYIKKCGLKNKVVFTGKIVDRYELAKHYSLADLFLFPSLYDCSSLVQIEAASQKTPSLFLYGSATSRTVTENINGFFSENNTLSFANKIIDIFKNKKLYEEVCKNAYRDLATTWDDVVKKVYLDYLKIIKNYVPTKKNVRVKKNAKTKIPVL